MVLSRTLLGAVVLLSVTGSAVAKTRAVTLREREQAACYHDATTLCADAIPDEAKVTACMVAKRAQVSPGCAVFFKKK